MVRPAYRSGKRPIRVPMHPRSMPKMSRRGPKLKTVSIPQTVPLVTNSRLRVTKAGIESARPDTTAPSLQAAKPIHPKNRPNGQPPCIAELVNLSADERQIVRESDEAFVHVSCTWLHWTKVRAGLVVLRDVAMRETGSNNVISKRFKSRFHQLLEGCSFRTIGNTTSKVLLQCADLGPAIDDWHAHISEDRRLRLNYPDRVLRAFREEQKPKPAHGRSARGRREAEIETVRQQAAAAMSIKDMLIKERDKQIRELRKHIMPGHPDRGEAGHPDDSDGADIARIVNYVVANSGGSEAKIRKVVDGLNKYLKRRCRDI